MFLYDEGIGHTPEDEGSLKEMGLGPDDLKTEGYGEEPTSREDYLAKAKPEEIIDKGDEAPDFRDEQLLPGETIINVEHPGVPQPTKHPSSLEAILNLTGVEKTGEIGEKGPSTASRASEEGKKESSQGLYDVVYGRDSLRVATDIADYYPKLLKATVTELAQWQGVENNLRSKEEPGRIVHETRSAENPIAQRITKERGWAWPYYSTVDATPMYIVGMAKVVDKEGLGFLNKTYEGRDGKQHTMLESLNNSLGWLEGRLGSNLQCLLEFTQSKVIDDDAEVWKDSPDAYFHADGRLANREFGIASIEVQALAHNALGDAASIYEKVADTVSLDEKGSYLNKAREFRERADLLKESVLKNFWVGDEHGGYFALATERDSNGNLTPLKVRSSNMGHLLNSRILDGDDSEVKDRREAVIKTLFSPEMLNVSGIRTVSNQEARFRPGGYHDGSVWLWDTYYIAQGLERHGYYGLAMALKNRIWNVMDKTKSFPEYARGGDDPEPKLTDRIIDIWDETNGIKHRIEQPPQEIQAWTVAAILAAKHKNDPLHPEKQIPKEATEPDKLEFEKEILEKVPKINL